MGLSAASKKQLKKSKGVAKGKRSFEKGKTFHNSAHK